MSQLSPLLSGFARDAVIVYLQANLNTALADPDILRGDGINIEPIPSSSYYIDEGFSPLKHPCVYVLADKFTFDYTRSQNYVNAVIPLEIITVVQDMRYDLVQKKAETYSRALFKVLDQTSLQDQAQRFQLKMISKEIEFTKTFESKMQASQKYFRKAVIYRWTAQHFENRLTT